MAGLAHLGIGLASKRLAPELPLGVLLVCAYAIDLMFSIFWIIGIEEMPKSGSTPWNPWSHSLFMAAVWSVLAAMITWLIKRNFKCSLFIGLLVFSHWIIDFISHPMMAVFPTDTGLPLFFEGSPKVGLGLWSTKVGMNFGEYGTLSAGIAIYIFTLRWNRKKGNQRVREKN
jgi:hypothetical protein